MANLAPLPVEYQTALDEAAKRQELAKMLFQKHLASNVKGQMVGDRFVGAHPLEYLAQALQGIQAQNMGSDAEAEANKVKTQAWRAQEAERQGLLKMQEPGQTPIGPTLEEPPSTITTPPDLMAAERAANAAHFPANRSLAESLAKRRMDMLKIAAPTSTGASVRAAVNAGGDASKLQDNSWGTPQVSEMPNGGNLVQTADQRGNIRQTGVAAPSKVSQTVGEKGGWEMVTDGQKALLKEREAVRAATSQMPQLLSAASILQADPNVLRGGGAPAVAFLKNLAPMFGLNPDSVSYDQLVAAAVPTVANAVKSFGTGTGVSDADREFAKSVSADPAKYGDIRTLQRLAHLAIRTTHVMSNDFNRRVGEHRRFAETHGVTNLPDISTGWQIASDKFAPGFEENLVRWLTTDPDAAGMTAGVPPTAPQPAAPRGNPRRRFDLRGQ